MTVICWYKKERKTTILWLFSSLYYRGVMEFGWVGDVLAYPIQVDINKLFETKTSDCEIKFEDIQKRVIL